MVTVHDIEQAATRIAPYVHRTPILHSRTLDALIGATVYFKAENLQKIGAFKARGAMNAVLQLSDEQAARGVVTHSSGNHAQALAYAAGIRGIGCTIVMPENAPRVKVEATRSYGAAIVFCEGTLQARESAVQEVIERTGAVLIHPYDNDHVITGQGTATLEFLQELSHRNIQLDILMAPVGGGGLMSGTAIAARGIQPNVRIIGAEPEAADDATRGLATGIRQPPKPPTTIADGLRTALSDRTFHYLQSQAVHMHTCSEQAIRTGLRLVMERLKTVIEPSAAVTLGVMLEHPDLFRGRTVGVILCGGNLDLQGMDVPV